MALLHAGVLHERSMHRLGAHRLQRAEVRKLCHPAVPGQQAAEVQLRAALQDQLRFRKASIRAQCTLDDRLVDALRSEVPGSHAFAKAPCRIDQIVPPVAQRNDAHGQEASRRIRSGFDLSRRTGVITSSRRGAGQHLTGGQDADSTVAVEARGTDGFTQSRTCGFLAKVSPAGVANGDPLNAGGREPDDDCCEAFCSLVWQKLRGSHGNAYMEWHLRC